MTGTTLCPLDDLVDGGARQFELEGHTLAVIRLGTDVYVIGDTCTHADVSLSEGEVDAETRHIECWRHGSSFSLETGAPDALPANRPVPVYEAHVEDGQVIVTLSNPEGPPHV